tara:strand:+ start:377 stop:610 length:234 start_codon:yes stop_codon:yes gene_type:complete
VVVNFGTVVPKGHLPVFSVDTEVQAKALLILACERDLDGNFIARELVEEQNLDNLYSFGERLAHIWFNVMGKEPDRR